MEKIHFCGYHGTSARVAEEIKKGGFRAGAEAFFAPSDNLWLAKYYAKYRAEQEEDSRYALIHASFPPSSLEFGLKGDHIKVTADKSSLIKVVNIMFFDIKSGKRLVG